MFPAFALIQFEDGALPVEDEVTRLEPRSSVVADAGSECRCLRSVDDGDWICVRGVFLGSQSGSSTLKTMKTADYYVVGSTKE
jgi:hypothetical protein